MARQLATSAPAGAVLADARLREGRAILSAPGCQSAARPIILDNAVRSDAEKLLAWVRTAAEPGDAPGDAPRLPRFVLVGGPFGGPEPPEELRGESLGDGPGRRVGRVQMEPLRLFEAGRASLRRLWLRGGYPEAFGAASDDLASGWLESYAADLAGGALAAWGLPREPTLVSTLLEAIAAENGSAFNENEAARALGVSRPTIRRYLGFLEQAGILFRVPALSSWSVPVRGMPGASRAIKSPALYIGDSGLLHALSGVRSMDELALKPGLAAASWSGFVVSQTRKVLPPGTGLYRYASADGAALDLVVARKGQPVLVASARRHRPTSVERSISYAARTMGSAPFRFIVVPEGDERELPGGFIAVGLGTFLENVAVV